MPNDKKKILIVDDDEAYLYVYADSFRSEGYEVFEAANGKIGLDAALKEHPDIILLDIDMPVMDGMAMLGKLQQDDWGKEAKVILLTNLSDAARVAEATEKGVYDYFVKKDWSLDAISKKVREKLA